VGALPVSRCILHFGMHKTGSSSIQQSFFAGLAADACTYLHFGHPNPSRPLAAAFRAVVPGRQGGGRGRRAPGAERERIRTELRRQLEARPGSVFLLSAESITGFREEEFAALAEFLAGHCDEVLAAGYVREPRGYIASAFQQVLKAGDARFELEKRYPRYRQRFAKLEHVLGAERVRYWPFDPAGFAQGCVVRDFCARLGFPVEIERIRRVNESLSLPALQLLYAYRRCGPGFGSGAAAVRHNELLIEQLRALSGPKLEFGDALLGPILARNGADRAWMEARVRLPSTAAVPAPGRVIVQAEDELLDFSPQALEWLGSQPGVGPRLRRDFPDPAAVATAVHALRVRLARDAAASGRVETQDELQGLWRAMCARRPGLAAVPEEAALCLVRATIERIGQELDGMREHGLRIPELGHFEPLPGKDGAAVLRRSGAGGRRRASPGPS